MKITPLDIQQQQFKGKMLGGLDPEDVDAFLQMVAQEMENLVRENTELKEQAKKATADLEQLAQQEKNLRETMLAAQRITEEMKANAQKEASLLISEAEMKGEKILADAERRLAQLNDQIQELRRQKLQFESSFKSLLDTHYKMLALDDE
ncbi:cell division protein DivIVA [Geotalea uraniireducens]|uniref:Cell division protein DivIVA n=1 Tax=Geotalea uraniireducens TaxID=351604 RepID=A0ABM8EIM4_9BACT|nr:DivIVA domain-containing protein [Geotalea uraniireducens]BDV42243.1 cell division protein DivIVA [Geotalea uraniireducens]